MDPRDFRTTINKVDAVVKEDDRSDRLRHEYESLQDGIEEMRSIQEELFELRERLHDAIAGYSPDNLEYWKSYGLAQLAVIAGSDEYMSRDESINSIIEDMEESMQEIRDELE